jgi:toxin ParE1/3/4
MIRILEEAEEELTSAALWYEKERAGLGEELLAEADRALTAIFETPLAWQTAPGSKGARRFVLKRFPFVVYYFLRSDDIWIIAFAHTSRQPGYWHHRIKH